MIGLRHKGYTPRSYVDVPEFSAYPEFSGHILPRNQWKARIGYLNDIEAMPYHWHKRHCKIKSQKSTNYCWMFGTVATVEVAQAQQGLDSPNLNAYATAYRGKRGANRGGYGVEACRYIQEFGIPNESDWASFQKTSRWPEEVQAKANDNKLVDFEEFGRQDIFDQVVSALIGPNPCAVTLAFSWWRHLVCGLGVAYKGNDYGLIIANSWGTRWSKGGLNGGYGIIWGSKAVPFESVAVRYAKAKAE